MLSGLKNNKSLNLEVRLTLQNGLEIGLDLRSYRKPAKWQTDTDGDVRNWEHLLNRCRFPFPKTYWLEQFSTSPAWHLLQGEQPQAKPTQLETSQSVKAPRFPLLLAFWPLFCCSSRRYWFSINSPSGWGEGYRYQLWMCAEVCGNAQLISAWAKCSVVLHWALTSPVVSTWAKQTLFFVSCFLARNKEGVISNLVLALPKLLSASICYLGLCWSSASDSGVPYSLEGMLQAKGGLSCLCLPCRWGGVFTWLECPCTLVWFVWCLVLLSANVCTSLGPCSCGSVLWAGSRTGGLSACQAGISVWLLCSVV